MHVSIIANGFQEDYITNLLNNLVDKVERIDFIGSTIHENRNIDKRIIFKNLRGDHTEDVSVFSKIHRNIVYYLKLIRYLFRTDAKIIHIQFFRFKLVEGILFPLFIRILGKKVIYTAHDVLPHSKDTLYYRIVYKLIYRMQHQIVAHTEYIKKRVSEEFNIKPSKIQVIHHGVYEKPENTLITKKVARQVLKLDEAAIVILFFGIIAEYKGPDLLLQSFSYLENKAKFQLVFAGKVSLEFKKHFETLLNQYKSDRIITFLRYIEDNEIEYFFKAADVVALPYKEASQSGVLFMSYSYGIPVIVPDLGGFPYDVAEGKTGFIYKQNDILSLQKVLNDFSQNWKFNNRNAVALIKKYAKENYSWENSCKDLAKLYEKMNL